LKTIIVTGASRGIGNHLALSLLEAGYHVVGIARAFQTKPDFESIICDVSISENVQSIFSQFRKRDDIYGLINCAGILHTKAVSSISNDEISELIDTNLKGTIFCCKNIVRPFLAHGSGRIINFSSIAAVSALRGDSVYSASKAAIETFSKAFAKEVSERSITVNCIAPGVVKTDMTVNLTPEQISKLVSLQIIQKQAEKNDIWNSVKFLLSHESQMITGQSFSIGGA
jgi:3-oxoacyl-[acyl-carrier protein] reductase